MHIYSYKNGRYLHEFIVREGEEIFVSASPIDCTLFKPDENGAPIPLYSPANDASTINFEAPIADVAGNSITITYSNTSTTSATTFAGDDLLFDAGDDTLIPSGNDTLTYGNDG